MHGKRAGFTSCAKEQSYKVRTKLEGIAEGLNSGEYHQLLGTAVSSWLFSAANSSKILPQHNYRSPELPELISNPILKWNLLQDQRAAALTANHTTTHPKAGGTR